MSDSISWINVLFRFLNFAVVVAVGWYVYRRYLKHTIEETIHDKEILSKGIKELSYMLEGQILTLDEELKDQHDRCEQLKEKVMEWQEAVNKLQAKKTEQRVSLLQQINDRIYERSARLSQNTQAKTMVPLAMMRAKESLQDRFSQSHNQREFLSELVNAMRDHDK